MASYMISCGTCLLVDGDDRFLALVESLAKAVEVVSLSAWRAYMKDMSCDKRICLGVKYVSLELYR